MKKIELSKGKVALVSDKDYELVSLFKWSFVPMVNGYAKEDIHINGKSYQIYMHRLIMNAPKGMEVDHINCQGLDNRRENLRLCTHQQNLMNQRRQRRNKSSKYRGVSKIKATGRLVPVVF